MNGLELSEKYYNEFGKPMLENFKQYSDKFAVGVFGEGSECYGFDDEISRDHDFSVGFCIFISDESDGEFGFPLMRAYNNLPKEYMGIKLKNRSLYGKDKYGVFTIREYFRSLIGTGAHFSKWQEWLYTPEYALANATNGKIFVDNEGLVTAFRKNLLDMPDDVRKKKIAARLVFMAQSGQYNFERCLKHGEQGAAQMALHQYIDNATSLIYTLNNSYAPFYKWRFRGITKLLKLRDAGKICERLLIENMSNEEKISQIAYINNLIINELSNIQLSNGSIDLESQAVNIMRLIQNREIRSLHIMEM